jgi:rhamnogalacturonyl hydrolase YesR
MEKPISIALADTILTRWPDPDDMPYQSWCYPQGYILCGFEKLWQFSGQQRYFDYLLRFGEKHVRPDGSIPQFTGISLDDMMAGTVIAALYEHTGQERYRIASEHIRASFTDFPRNVEGGYWHALDLPHEEWIDGIFMGGMTLLRCAAVLGDGPNGFSENANQIRIMARHCRKGDSGLYYHAWDEARSVGWADKKTGLSPEVWSEGLGWYALILAETMALLPREHSERPVMLDILQRLLEGLRKHQDPVTGLWYQVVDKGDRSDNWHDTSGSGMFLYTFQKALDLGLGDPGDVQRIQKGFASLKTKARPDAHGLIDIYDACDGVCVLPTYQDYINYPIVVNAKEAIGSFLWAAVQIEKPSPDLFK